MNGDDIDALAHEVLSFWFEELASAQWWKVDRDLDSAIEARFGALNASLVEEVDLAWLATPERALAAVIALDQFSRNIFRGQAKAFAQDAKARAVAEQAIARGLDAGLPPERRHFLYMPFMHSESEADQARSITLCATLGPGMLRHAEQHKAVIDRFGRFPKRNTALGRENTEAEAAYLAESTGGAV